MLDKETKREVGGKDVTTRPAAPMARNAFLSFLCLYGSRPVAGFSGSLRDLGGGDNGRGHFFQASIINLASETVGLRKGKSGLLFGSTGYQVRTFTGYTHILGRWRQLLKSLFFVRATENWLSAGN